MTVSETTTLLTLRSRIKSNKHETKSISHKDTVSLVFLIVSVTFAIAGITTFTGKNSIPTEQVEVLGVPHSSTHIPIESELLQWDDWKNNIDSAHSWFDGAVREIPNLKDEVSSQVQSDTSQNSNWWDGTADSREKYTNNAANNAERFGIQVKTWWGDITTSSERAVADVDMEDKVTTIENNFRIWWKVANNAERRWWNATLHQLQIDEKIIGDWLAENSDAAAERGSEFINLTNSKFSHEKNIVVKLGSIWLNASENELEKNAQNLHTLGKDWVDSTEEAVKSDVRATGKRADKWLKSSEHTLLSEGNKVLQSGQEWLNGTEETMKSEEAMALKQGKDLLNAATDNLHGDEAAAIKSAKKLIDSGKFAVKGELENVGDEEKRLWNETEETLLHERDAAAQKFAVWWTTTKSLAGNKITNMTATEKSWWSATEVWLRRHVQPTTLGGNVAMPEKTLLYLNNSFAYSLLMNGFHWYDYSNDYFLLQGGLDAQINQAYCAVASAAAVMNSFRPLESIPTDQVYFPHQYATQENLFNECVQDTVILRNDTFDGLLAAPGGLSLEQLRKLMRCYDFNVTAHFVDPANMTIDDVRQGMEEALMNPSKRVIVNFDRHSLGQDGGGHFSPVGSYSKKEDSFLIMDVAKYKYPPVWVPTERLYISLATEDGCGEWHYPGGQQTKLRLLNHTASSREHQKVMRHLKCRKMHRGFIIVQVPS